MSHSSSSSHSSLLQLNRPDSLLPQLPSPSNARIASEQARWLEQHERTQQQLCTSKGSNGDMQTHDQEAATSAFTIASGIESMTTGSTSPSSPSSSRRASKSQAPCVMFQPVASTSSGLKYLNMEPTSSPCAEHAHGDLPSPLEAPNANKQHFAHLLATASTTVIGEVMDRAQWQPDSESALCTYPLCTANFAQPTYFFLGPRRHHCRMCGHVYCDSHSATRAPLVQTDAQGKRRVVKERVCDSCCQKTDPTTIALPQSAQQSRRNSASTESDDHSDLVTPSSEDGHPLSASAILLRSQSRVDVDNAQPAQLAPIEDWMDRSGVLSLYPLAVKPSHSRSKRSSSPAPSAGPLFAPSISARREAKQKELERMTLRQRRMGQETGFWLPGKWGYKREDFDPTFDREDDEEQLEALVGGVVEDGPIRFRMGTRKVVTPGATSIRG